MVLLFCTSRWMLYQVKGKPYSSGLMERGGGDGGWGRAEQWGPERGQPPAPAEGSPLPPDLVVLASIHGKYPKEKHQGVYVLPWIFHTSYCLWKKLGSTVLWTGLAGIGWTWTHAYLTPKLMIFCDSRQTLFETWCTAADRELLTWNSQRNRMETHYT